MDDQVEGVDYVDRNKLITNKKELKAFNKWMNDQTCPLIPDCPGAVFPWDYEKWKRYKGNEPYAMWD